MSERLVFEEVPRSELVDGEWYLVDMKHGLIGGFWNAREECFSGYYWQDLVFDGQAFRRVAYDAVGFAHDLHA